MQTHHAVFTYIFTYCTSSLNAISHQYGLTRPHTSSAITFFIKPVLPGLWRRGVLYCVLCTVYTVHSHWMGKKSHSAVSTIREVNKYKKYTCFPYERNPKKKSKPNRIIQFILKQCTFLTPPTFPRAGSSDSPWHPLSLKYIWLAQIAYKNI